MFPGGNRSPLSSTQEQQGELATVLPSPLCPAAGADSLPFLLHSSVLFSVSQIPQVKPWASGPYFPLSLHWHMVPPAPGCRDSVPSSRCLDVCGECQVVPFLCPRPHTVDSFSSSFREARLTLHPKDPLPSPSQSDFQVFIFRLLVSIIIQIMHLVIVYLSRSQTPGEQTCGLPH